MKRFACLLVCWFALTAAAQKAAVVITIDPERTFQVMQGFGSTVLSFEDGHLWNAKHGSTAPLMLPEQRDEIIKLVYGDLGLTRLRFTPNSGQTRRGLDQEIAFTKLACRSGANTFFVSPLRLGAGMNGSNPDKLAANVLEELRYWKENGMEMPFYSLVNEPGRIEKISTDYLLEVIKLLGPKLREAGINTRLVITDDWSAGGAYKRCSAILEDPEARQFVGALAYHLYGGKGNVRKMAALSQTYHLPVWMTEFSGSRYMGSQGGVNWASTMHDLMVNGNVSAIDYMWAFFGEYSEKRWPGNTLVLLKTGANGLRYRGYEFNTMYQAMKLFARFIRPGFTRIASIGASRTIKTLAFTRGHTVVITLINASDSKQDVQLVLPAASPISVLEATQTVGNQPLESLETTVRDKHVRVMLAPNSVSAIRLETMTQ